MTDKDEIEKYINSEGKVAVLFSSGYGAGWSSWNEEHKEQLLFDPEIVKIVLGNSEAYDGSKLIRDHCDKKYGIGSIYTGGVDTLEIYWATPGELFQIDEFDGYESVSSRDLENWIEA